MGYTDRRRSTQPRETWPILEEAAKTRFYDGLHLASSDAGHAAGAIYLLGYVAEILLKAAYCRVTGLDPATPAYPVLRSVSANVHDLSRLYDLLITTRLSLTAPMGALIAGQLRLHVDTIEAHREVTMRYYSLPATLDEVAEV